MPKSRLGILFRFKKKKYILKARIKEGNVSRWESIAEFNHKVSLEEVRDIIDSYLDEGYDAFRLDEYTVDNKFVKMHWFKSYKNVKKKEENILAQFIAYETLKKELLAKLQSAGVVTGEDDFDKLLTFLDKLSRLQQYTQPFQQIPQEQMIPQPQPTGTVQPQPQQEINMNINIEELSKKAEEEAVKLKEKMANEVVDSLTLCKKLGECIEEEGAQK